MKARCIPGVEFVRKVVNGMNRPENFIGMSETMPPVLKKLTDDGHEYKLNKYGKS